MGNFAYIDNQNLYMATSRARYAPWDVDMQRFRVYLRDKFKVDRATLFMGSFEDSYFSMYECFHRYGYEIAFREHAHTQLGKKKGNVDADIVFEMMLDAYTSGDFGKTVLVSGDGDYKKVVSHLIEVGKFEKLLVPSRASVSSLYKGVPEKFKVFLDDRDVMAKIRRQR